ncbi:MAG: hypothetical protein ABSA16_13605 [Thermoguttaceae bacterium]|jgi:hypothetical protein
MTKRRPNTSRREDQANTTALQKCLLAAAVALEIVWVVFLMILAATK